MSIVSLVHSAKFIVVLYRLHLVLYRLCCVGCIKQRVSPLVQVHFSGIDFLLVNIKISFKQSFKLACVFRSRKKKGFGTKLVSVPIKHQMQHLKACD